MHEAESFQETLEFLDEALRGVDVTLDGDDISSLKSSLLDPFDGDIEQELDLLAPIAPPQQSSQHQSKPRGRRKKNYNQNKARQPAALPSTDSDGYQQ
ncbi:hypothetical protein PF010_g17736 [Phytophthora fragariae]|uniref:Uncharacterized protein n=1 Tax=Phytophthora fragariae TaxID=53985 RepID=A0A6A3ZU57_9STRA|nr:hypothetical protein PF009_g8059 [Phytophthora fragariae]KAE8992647.1 hypothetical protein PF011_g17469 [Phytophthora fragariae]KAE9092732.1 hypothetical protein PF010_g17736 [Phytophthora fragariae]KAE9123901.1 hypothetical protein PF006_g17319 [Phytophthora fragariae]KAE9241124.1 hypothetical protein PF002_g9427 [Phytophthora fragariae]